MALLIAPSGSVRQVFPTQGPCFTTEELGVLVEGRLDCVHLPHGRLLWINTEGKLHGLPSNPPFDHPRQVQAAPRQLHCWSGGRDDAAGSRSSPCLPLNEQYYFSTRQTAPRKQLPGGFSCFLQ